VVLIFYGVQVLLANVRSQPFNESELATLDEHYLTQPRSADNLTVAVGSGGDASCRGGGPGGEPLVEAVAPPPSRRKRGKSDDASPSDPEVNGEQVVAKKAMNNASMARINAYPKLRVLSRIIEQ